MQVSNRILLEGPLSEKWPKHRASMELVSPNNRNKLDIIVVGTGIAGAPAAASLARNGL